MSEPGKNSIYKALREQYPVFIYDSFLYKKQDDDLILEFDFRLGDSIRFTPQQKINIQNYSLSHLPPEALDLFVFHVGMAELVSYWKAACPPRVLIRPFQLNENQQAWWKKLYFNGLGEFYYLNGIQDEIETFMSFEFNKDAVMLPSSVSLELYNEVLVPVGGGKDSVVTLSLLSKANIPLTGLVINQREATRNCLQVAGLDSNTVEIQRNIDPMLLQLNQQGFLNGHTPFSSLLAFTSVFISAITRKRYIALSNEASANEVTIPGTHVNHQYSKSFVFEHDFRTYVMQNICSDICYFSFLRPLNELQIAALFSGNSAWFGVFKSCNVGSKQDTWCCNCPKCMFTYIMLAPFISQKNLIDIFGSDLWENKNMISFVDQLAGISTEKPFECVGTLEEVNAALSYVLKNNVSEQLPLILDHYQKGGSPVPVSTFYNHLVYWNAEHALPEKFEHILKQALHQNKKPI